MDRGRGTAGRRDRGAGSRPLRHLPGRALEADSRGFLFCIEVFPLNTPLGADLVERGSGFCRLIGHIAGECVGIDIDRLAMIVAGSNPSATSSSSRTLP